MASSVESVVDSYETRVKTIGDLMLKAVDVLNRFDREQELKVMELRHLLAYAESLRKKDFDTLMTGIWARRREKERQVALTLDSFLKEQHRLVAWLREVVTLGDIGPEQFKLLSLDYLAWQMQTEADLSRMLRELHLEQEELAAGLNKLLQKGEKVRIKDFKTMISAIQLRQRGRQSGLGRMLDELWGVDKAVATQWSQVITSARA